MEDAWARQGLAGGNSAAYFTIDNRSGQEDVLLSASSPAAKVVEVHMSMAGDGGTMGMQMQENVPVPARSQVEFTPGGLHLMLIDLTQDLKAGDTIELKLNFQTGGEVSLQAAVQ